MCTLMFTPVFLPGESQGREAWWAAIYGVAQSRTRLKRCSSSSMFTSALFTIAKTWKQTKCPLKEEQIEKTWYTYTVDYYAAIEKNETMSFAATWLHLAIIILSEARER